MCSSICLEMSFHLKKKKSHIGEDISFGKQAKIVINTKRKIFQGKEEPGLSLAEGSLECRSVRCHLVICLCFFSWATVCDGCSHDYNCCLLALGPRQRSFFLLDFSPCFTSRMEKIPGKQSPKSHPVLN